MNQIKLKLERVRQIKNLILLLMLTLGLLFFSGQPADAQNLQEILTDTSTESDDNSQKTTNTISTEVDAAADQDIKKRLTGIFSEIEQFAGIEVAVSNSVVTLSGELLSANSIEAAGALAAKVQGVVEVDNQLTVTTAVSERLDSSIDELSKDSRRFFSNIPLLGLALAVIIAGWFLGRYIASMRSVFIKIAPNSFIADLFGRIVWLIVFIIGLYIGLRLLDATELIGTVLGAAGIVGLAVGFAVRDTVENYIASILLSIRHPFKTKDYVSIEGIEGSVARLTSRATILVSAEGNHVRIPNSVVYKSTITNYSRNPLRRFDFTVGIDRSDDILAAQILALEVIEKVDGVLSDPGCTITVDKLGESNTTLLIRAWVDQTVHDLMKVRSEAIRQLKLGFDDANIIMPEPTYKLKISNSHPGQEVNFAQSSPSTQPSEHRTVDITKPRTTRDIGDPAQSLDAEPTIDKAIDAELEISNENLLSESAAQE